MGKKLTSLFLSIVMVLTILPQTVFAGQADESHKSHIKSDENMTEQVVKIDDVKKSGKQKLNHLLSKGGLLSDELVGKEAQKGYSHSYDAEIVEALENFQLTIDVEGFGITRDNVGSIIHSLLTLNPQLFYIKSYYYYYSGTNVLKLQFILDDTEEVCRSRKNEVEAALQEALDAVDISQMTKEEIVLFYHDYLVSNIAYAYDEYKAGNLTQEVYDVYGALVKKKAVCQGYAMAFAYIMQNVGITCGYASSKNINHAWNVVELGGNWYQIDTTWDDPVYDNLGNVQHGYFLVSDAKLLQLNSGRSDFIALVPGGGTYPGAASSAFEEGFWSHSNTLCYYYKGSWYYTDKDEFKIVKYNYKTKTETTVLAGDGNGGTVIWRVPGSSSFYRGNFSRLAGSCNMLYYTMPEKICALNLETNARSDVFAPNADNARVYGMAIRDGNIVYVMKAKPGSGQAETILQTGKKAQTHNIGVVKEVAATCVTNGCIVRQCTNCGKMDTTITQFATGHKYTTSTIPATPSQDGKIIRVCTVCNEVHESAHRIYRPQKIELSWEEFTYSGKVLKPSARVKDSSGAEIPAKYYSVAYVGGCKKPGRYKVEVTFKDKYSGTMQTVFSILPKGTKISKVTPGSKGLSLKWKKQKNVDGYQIQYSVKNDFRKGKTIKIKNNKTTSKNISKLKTKKKYYIRIRTFKKVKENGKTKTLYSVWSPAKKATVK